MTSNLSKIVQPGCRTSAAATKPLKGFGQPVLSPQSKAAVDLKCFKLRNESVKLFIDPRPRAQFLPYHFCQQISALAFHL